MKMLIFALVTVVSIAFGQENGKPMFFETGEACLAATEGSFSVYVPHFTTKLGWWQEKVSLGTAEVVKLSGPVCAREFTVEGWKIVRWPEDSSHFKAGDKMADIRCGNDVEQIWQPPVPAPTPAPEVFEPPPTATYQVISLPPPVQFLESSGSEEEINVEIVAEKGHKFPIPCIPREKGWYGIGLPLAECAALAYGAYEIYGAAHGLVLIKNLACVVTILPNGMKSICP